MGKIVLRVEGLGKKYRLGTPTGSHRLSEALYGLGRAAASLPRRLLRRAASTNGRPDRAGEFWALKDVSFEVERGEVVGIIGRNGAGKSTLLKILSRITEPTAGRFGLGGRVGSLLEVGTGFHPELTGRENVFLNGTFLGMSRSEVQRQLDDIVAFADIGEFLDTPVKRYSSGMVMRLGFAVAAHLQPEILIVDEVLAVGDAAFQKKCLAKMKEVGRGGRTVLFVSHNLHAVQTLCERVLWLDGGQLTGVGDPRSIIRLYQSDNCLTIVERVYGQQSSAKAQVVRLGLQAEDGRPADQLNLDTPVMVSFEYLNRTPGTCLNVSFHLYNEENILVFVSAPIRENCWFGRPHPVGLYRSSCRIPSRLLNEGSYRIRFFLVENAGTVLESDENALTFRVLESASREHGWYGRWEGVVRPDLEWRTDRVDSDGKCNG